MSSRVTDFRSIAITISWRNGTEEHLCLIGRCKCAATGKSSWRLTNEPLSKCQCVTRHCSSWQRCLADGRTAMWSCRSRWRRTRSMMKAENWSHHPRCCEYCRTVLRLQRCYSTRPVSFHLSSLLMRGVAHLWPAKCWLTVQQNCIGPVNCELHCDGRHSHRATLVAGPRETQFAGKWLTMTRGHFR